MTNCLLHRFFLLMTVLAPALTAVRADTISNFKLDATFNNGAVGSGLITIDVTTGSITSISVQVTGTGGTYSFAGPEAQGLSGGYYAVSFEGADNGLILRFPQTSLVNYVGGMLCSTSYACPTADTLYGTNATGNVNASTAMLTAVSPEPESLVLLGTGLAGVASVMFRRKRPALAATASYLSR